MSVVVELAVLTLRNNNQLTLFTLRKAFILSFLPILHSSFFTNLFDSDSSGKARIVGGALCTLLLMFMWFVVMLSGRSLEDEPSGVGPNSASVQSSLMSGNVLSEDMLDPSLKQEWMSEQRSLIMRNGGYNASSDFVGKHVVHLSAGPRPLSYVMAGARVSVVEPLALLYLTSVDGQNSTGGYLELQQMQPIFKNNPEKVVAELENTADIVLLTTNLGVSNLGNILKTARAYLKPDGYLYLIISLHQDHPTVAKIIDSVWNLGFSLHRGTGASNLSFERGACTLPQNQLRSDLTFDNCFFIMRPSMRN